MVPIVPHRGAGPILFGMTRKEVERIMGKPSRRMRLSEFDLSDVDFYREFDVHYDVDDRCCAIEFTRDRPHVTYDGYDLFAHPAMDVRAWARARDPNLTDEDGFTSAAMGLSMFSDQIDEPDLDERERAAPAQSFLAFRPGYYEQENARLLAAGLIPREEPRS